MAEKPRLIAGRAVYKKIVGGSIAVAIGLYLLTQTQNNEAFAWFIIFVGAVIVFAAWRSVPDPKVLVRYYLDPPKTVNGLISAWAPQPARSEADYEKSLHTFLKSKLPFTKITRQYGSARVKCDLAVGTEVFIELKKGLKSTNRLQRLIGQIELYRKEWEGKPLFIVLLGDSEDDLLHDLNRSIGGD